MSDVDQWAVRVQIADLASKLAGAVEDAEERNASLTTRLEQMEGALQDARELAVALANQLSVQQVRAAFSDNPYMHICSDEPCRHALSTGEPTTCPRCGSDDGHDHIGGACHWAPTGEPTKEDTNGPD